MQIAQFCHYMNENHGMKNGSDRNDGTMASDTRPNVVTILTGDKLTDRKDSNLSYTGILNAATINFEQITEFYAKYKKKWGNPINIQCWSNSKSVQHGLIAQIKSIWVNRR